MLGTTYPSATTANRARQDSPAARAPKIGLRQSLPFKKTVGAVEEKLMRSLTRFSMFCIGFVCSASVATPETRAAGCPAGTTARLTFVNNCADDVWMVETPPGAIPGDPTAATRAQWAWFVTNYATQESPYSDGAAAMKLPTGGTPQVLCVPDKGAPSGNFRFYLDCPGDAPFSSAGCTIGAATGDRSGVNTLFEASYGCDPSLAKNQCAFNYSSPAPPPATTLTSAIDASSDPATFTVASTSGLPASPPYQVGIGIEILNVTQVAGTSLTASRAQDATTQQAHGTGSPVYELPNCQFNPSIATCQPIDSSDYFDVSAVDGYTIPLTVTVTTGQSTCNRATTDAGMLDLASCPTETAATLYSTLAAQQAQIKSGVSLLNSSAAGLQSCAAPYKWFQTTTLGNPPVAQMSDPGCNPINSSCYYAGSGCDNSQAATSCPGGSGPQERVGPEQNGSYGIQNTEWVTVLHAMGYLGYTWQYDDGLGTQQCSWGEETTVTLCPAGGTPYLENQLWTFSTATDTCSTQGQTGKPDGVKTFGSLFACQTANMLYTCKDLTADDPYQIPTQVCSADPAATKSGKGLTWANLIAGRTLACDDFIRAIVPGGGYNPQLTTVVSGLDNTSDPVTFTVADGSIFPAVPFDVGVEQEILSVTQRSGNSLTATRGQEGTTAKPHPDGAQVLPTLSLPICTYSYPAAAF